ncbi:hypothetical protein BDR26DRAFT_931186 [Obelidium mucronatum]|nr:hypothetical protein BDR26DRAFT_931186 [Obelidium mucronatum]
MASPHYWATHSKITAPGPAGAAAIAPLADTLRELRTAASRLVFHYLANDAAAFAAAEIPEERRAEIDLRTAAALFGRVLALQGDLAAARAPGDRVVGCCRDATVLFVALAREKGIPARARSGFAAYFVPGFLLDHVVAEVWDDKAQRWIMVDPEMSDDWVCEHNGLRVDWCNLTPDQFITAPIAWKGLCDGSLPLDHMKFCVNPKIDLAILKSWPQIASNVIMDLAMLNKVELLLWDSWDSLEFRNSMEGGPLSDADASIVDAICEATADLKDGSTDFQTVFQRKELKVTPVIFSMNVLTNTPRHVDISDLLED